MISSALGLVYFLATNEPQKICKLDADKQPKKTEVQKEEPEPILDEIPPREGQPETVADDEKPKDW